jgi:hypothetical protein
MPWAAAVLVVALLQADPADAPQPAALGVERLAGANDCPDESALAASVAEIDRRATPGVQAQVTFERQATGYRATLRLQGAKEGERTLTDTGTTCAALGKAVAISLALSLAGESEAPPPPAPPPPPPPAPPPSAAGVLVGLTSGAALELVGAPSLAVGADVGVTLGRRLLIELGGRHVLARASTLEPGSVQVSLDAAVLRLCGVLVGVEGPWQALACAAGAAGRLRGEGTGYPMSSVATSAWAAAGGGVDARRRFSDGRWVAALGVEALAPLRQDTFSIDNGGVAYRSSAVSWMLRLGLAVRVW